MVSTIPDRKPPKVLLPYYTAQIGVGGGMYPVYGLSRWMLSWLVLYLRLNRIEPTVRLGNWVRAVANKKGNNDTANGNG